jgi:predicted DNA-binding protein (MmcQ/YjbR family)
MNLFEREAFEAFATGLDHCFIVHQWGDASVAKVGTPDASKIFAILSNWSSDQSAISFKCSEMSFRMLPELAGIRPAPYLARAKWVEVSPGSALEEDALGPYITEAHRLAFLTLPKALRERLGAISVA